MIYSKAAVYGRFFASILFYIRCGAGEFLKGKKMKKYVDTKVMVSAAVGVLVVGLLFAYAGTMPVISDVKKGFNG